MDWLVVDASWWPETVSPLELGWVLTSLLTLWLAVCASRRWRRVKRGLRRDSDAGPRDLAGMIEWVCYAVAFMAVVEVVIAIPSLLTVPRPDTDASTVTLVVQIVTPAGFVVNNLVLMAMTWFMGNRTRKLGRRRPETAEENAAHPQRRQDDMEAAT